MLRSAPSWLRQCPVAHRGLHGLGRPENSREAFEAAAKAGYAVELDVHRLSDGTVVVFHDDDLQRMLGVEGVLAAQTWAEVKDRPLKGGDTGMPRLQDVLALLDGRAPILLEVKPTARIEVLAAAVWACLRRYRGPIAVQSFDPRCVRWFAQHAPALPVGLLSSDFRSEPMGALQRFVLRRLLLAPWVGAQFIGYDAQALPHWAPNVARQAGLPVLAWTIRSPREAEAVAPWVDNIIFEGFRPPTGSTP